MTERIQMSRQYPWRAENPEAVIVARPSKWGNPYRVGEAGWNSYYPELPATAGDAVMMYELDLTNSDGIWWERGNTYLTPETVRAELAGRDLACWCPLDQPCHADVLLRVADAVLGVVREVGDVKAEQREKVAELVADLVDPDPCEWDHNHSCQAHGYFYIPQGELCPNEAGRQFVVAAAIRGGEKK